MPETTTTLTPAETAYAHLASLPKGAPVWISGRRFYSEAIVTTPQRDYCSNIERAYLIATDRFHPEVQTRVTVASLMKGKFSIQADTRWPAA